MSAMVSSTTSIPRLESGVRGLDVVLGGGFLMSGVYMLLGSPGSGKTILANQICYSHIGAGGRALYVTLLAESHSRMLQHLRTMSFFSEDVTPEQLSYISAFQDLEAGGLRGLMDVLRREMRSRKASLLVLDGLVAATLAASGENDMKKFIHEVQTSAVFLGCTVLLLTSGTVQRVYAEHTMVDGLIELEDAMFDARAERALQVRKFRGSSTLRGKHSFRIDNDGIRVFPRIESLYDRPQEDIGEVRAISTGIPTLDAMIAVGGLPVASASVVVGSAGTGKTTTALHFISQSTIESPGLMFSFFESPSRLRVKARHCGIDVESAEKSGALRFIWHSQGEHLLDALAHQLLDEVAERKVERVVIDGLSGFLESAVHPERTGRFFSTLANELRRRGVTVLMTLETRDIVTSVVATPYGVSGFVDNLFFLRFVEAEGKVLRLLTIIKMRDSDFDVSLNAVEMSSTGMRIAGRHTADGDVIPRAASVDERRLPIKPSNDAGVEP